MTTRLTGMLLAVTWAVALATPAFAQPAPAQEDIQKLFDAGRYQEVVDKTPADAPPDAQYRKGLARRKIDQHGEAKEDFGRLSGGGEAWSAVGESARAMIDGNLDGALEAARKGVQHGPELAQAHYQLGLVHDARSEHADAANAFARAAELQPQMAYAHYMSGMSFYKAKRVDKMAVYFENFLKLAPQAPERPAVLSIMKTIRGR
jgi:tetratricopeptide (TPR) repeat protein